MVFTTPPVFGDRHCSLVKEMLTLVTMKVLVLTSASPAAGTVVPLANSPSDRSLLPLVA